MAASKGDSLAIQFISNWFRTYRLSKSYKTTNSYLQNVPLTHSDYSKSALSIDGKEFELNKQWTYIDGRNIIGPSTAEVIFIGYGISTPSFDEFKNIDIEGKFVLKQWVFLKTMLASL